jgi:hypothetical protein
VWFPPWQQVLPPTWGSSSSRSSNIRWWLQQQPAVGAAGERLVRCRRGHGHKVSRQQQQQQQQQQHSSLGRAAAWFPSTGEVVHRSTCRRLEQPGFHGLC